jgi:NAD(P) transhydrogenase
MSGRHHEYDLVVIGSGPAGQKAALAAAKQGCRVAIIERQEVVGAHVCSPVRFPARPCEKRYCT